MSDQPEIEQVEVDQLPGERVAMFVIHGIGEQKPYETLDQFARGLVRSLEQNGAKWTIAPELEKCVDPLHLEKDWTRVSLRLTPPPNPKIESITLFEYYWAPITENKVSYLKSLAFLVSTGLRPFQYLFSNLNALDAAQEHTDKWEILGKELVRIFLFFFPLIAAIGCLGAWLAGATAQLPSLLKSDWALLCVLFLVAFRWLCIYGFGKLLRDSWKGLVSVRSIATVGLIISLFLPYYWLPLLTLACGFPLLKGVCSFGLVDQIAWLLSPAGITGWETALARFLFLSPKLQQPIVLIIGVLFAYVARLILVDYVGDLAVYLNADERSENFAARSQILDECTQSLTGILREKNGNNPKFDRVIVVGHSLGSVIAYDTINELLDRARSGASPDPADLQRLSGMVTFGCPLNKVYYFFREQLPGKQEIRRQILDLLHSFRIIKAPTSDQFEFTNPHLRRWEQAETALEEGFLWVNVWSWSDPISGKMLFYDLKIPDNQRRLFYRIPLYAHVCYWEDDRFYGFIIQKFLSSTIAGAELGPLVSSAIRESPRKHLVHARPTGN